jgi:hypothetical protein
MRTATIYQIEFENGITSIRFTKNPAYADLQKAIDDLANNHAYEFRLWDFSEIAFDLSMNEIQNIAEYGKEKFTKPNNAAIVAPQDLAYGVLRAFEVYRKQEHAHARVFRTRQEALAWLEKQRTQTA